MRMPKCCLYRAMHGWFEQVAGWIGYGLQMYHATICKPCVRILACILHSQLHTSLPSYLSGMTSAHLCCDCDNPNANCKCATPTY